MHPSSILSYYPSYEILDEVLSYSKYDTVNFYFDLKNNLQSLYMQHTVYNIVESSSNTQYVNTSVFESLLSFLYFHKLYCIKRKIKYNFYIFFEVGQSYYHTNLSKKYKISRMIDNLYDLDKGKRDLFREVVKKNFQLIFKACNMMPNIKVIMLQNLEADFVPYYLVRNKLVSVGDQVAHLIYSNDHDLYQCVQDNVYIFSKAGRKKEIIKKNEVMNKYLRLNKGFPDSYLPLAMAIVGDVGDDINGVSGIATKRVSDILDEIVSLAGGLDTLFSNVISSKPIFGVDYNGIKNKYVSKIIGEESKSGLISRNLKLVSFELLSRELDDPSNTSMVEKRNQLLRILGDNRKAKLDSMKKALEMNRVFLDRDIMEVIYYNGG